ncbi:MAG: hypothetical protein EOM73_02105 [Bacteroidia bacterium]|nr:hypothetical protein [Bacteroidia bacterium]
MKRFNLILVLLFLVSLFFCSAKAQTKVDNQVETSVTIKGKTGTFELIGLENVRITPSGNFLRVVTFQLDKSHPLVQLANPVYIFSVIMRIDLDGDGTTEVITDEMAVLTKSGNLKFVYHSNGAGSNLPVGWDF